MWEGGTERETESAVFVQGILPAFSVIASRSRCGRPVSGIYVITGQRERRRDDVVQAYS